jgi:hypothetical protein
MKLYAFLLVAAVLVGCRTRDVRTAAQFDFLRAGLPMTTVTNRAGSPDRELGSGQLRWEYDLADGSQLVVFPVVRDYTNLAT